MSLTTTVSQSSFSVYSSIFSMFNRLTNFSWFGRLSCSWFIILIEFTFFASPPQFRTGQIVPMSWGVLVRKVILKQPNTTNFWFQKVYFFQYPSDSFVHQGHHCHEYNLWILQVNPGEFIDSLKWYGNIFTILLSITIFYLVLIPKFKPLKASKVASFSFVDCKSSGNVYIDTQVPQLKRSV